MARDASPLTFRLQYLLARIAAMGLSTLNADTSTRMGAAMGRFWFDTDTWASSDIASLTRPVRKTLNKLLRGRHLRAVNHLAMCFPDRPAEEHLRLAESAFEHLVQLAVEVLHTPYVIHEDSWMNRIRMNNLGPALEILNAGRPALLVTGHLGNWEVLGYAMAVLGYPTNAIARPIDNPLINRWLMGVRERRGMRIITKWNATDTMVNVLQGGGTLGFIADQNAGDKGMFVPFFGKLASTYKSIGLLAINQNVPIICGYAHRIGPGFRFEIGTADIIQPEDWANADDPLYYVTARYMRAIETMIRACPEQYLWMHRRWKSRPRWERQGKPMPATLRHNIESLPWMDAPTLARLETPPGLA